MSIVLRPYQHIAIETVRAAYRCGARAPLLVAPTGSGKTVCFSFIAQNAIRKARRVWILAHRQELVDQISETLKDFAVPHGFIAAGYPQIRTAPVQVCSVQTLIRRMDKFAPPDLIIIDEAHHATVKNTIGKIVKAYPQARLLGVTATPTRLSGEGLGDVFSDMILGPTTQELIDLGALSPVRVFAPPTVDTSGLHIRAGEFVTAELNTTMNKPKITGDVIEHYRKHCDRKRAVAFCVSVQHAHSVAADFVSAGYRAVAIDGTTERHIRRDAISKFQRGEIHVLTSCDLVSEGFDCPGIEVGISLRPTASLGLWLQQCGRCLRTFPGKHEAVILDHAGNALRHGLPTESREWTLEGSAGANGRHASESISVRVCTNCFAASRSGSQVCSQCGTYFPVKARKVEEIEGELQEIKARPKATPERKEQGRSRSLEALIALGTMRGYKNPQAWAEHVYHGRMRKRA